MKLTEMFNKVSSRGGFIHRCVRKVFPRGSWLHVRLQSLTLWVNEKVDIGD